MRRMVVHFPVRRDALTDACPTPLGHGSWRNGAGFIDDPLDDVGSGLLSALGQNGVSRPLWERLNHEPRLSVESEEDRPRLALCVMRRLMDVLGDPSAADALALDVQLEAAHDQIGVPHGAAVLLRSVSHHAERVQFARKFALSGRSLRPAVDRHSGTIPRPSWRSTIRSACRCSSGPRAGRRVDPRSCGSNPRSSCRRCPDGRGSARHPRRDATPGR